MEKARAKALISGRVQGVWFRASTRDMARPLGLTGTVRNLPWRQVEAFFEGPRDKVEEALAWCRQGPPGARVTDVEITWLEPTGELDDFEILY
jgi:acylphosphatase